MIILGALLKSYTGTNQFNLALGSRLCRLVHFIITIRNDYKHVLQVRQTNTIRIFAFPALTLSRPKLNYSP